MSTAVDSRVRTRRPVQAGKGGGNVRAPGTAARALVAGVALVGFGASVLVAWFGQAGPVGVVAAGVIAACVGGVAVLAIRHVAGGQAVLAPASTGMTGLAGSPAAMTDGDGKIEEANQAFWRTFARFPVEHIDDLIKLTRDPDSTRQKLDAMLGAGRDKPASACLDICSGDHDRIYRVRVNSQGSRLVWHFDDVSEERAAVAAARAEAAAYRALLDRLPVGVTHVDGDGIVRFANTQLAALLRLAGGEIVDQHLRWSDLASETLAAVDTQQPTLLDLRDSQGGHHRAAWYEAALAAEETGAGRVGVVIPRPKRSDGAEPSGETDTRFAAALHQAPVGIALLEPQGGITYANLSFGRIAFPDEAESGAERKLRGQPLIDLVADDDRAPVETRLAEAVASRETVDAVDVAWRAKESMIVSMIFTPIIGPDGAVESVLVTLGDLTTQRQLEQQFTQAQKMQAVGQLAGGVAHDFNNLLTAMIGFCDLLLARMVPGDQSYEDVDQILQNANRAANLVRQLLAFSRKQTLTPRVVSLTDTVAELGHMLRRLLGEAIELRIKYARDLWLVKADESQLTHVIINLAVNARDAMGGSGALTIQTTNFPVATKGDSVHEAMPPGDYVCIKVADTGSGIPKEIIDRIWEPFFTTKELGEGTGLGLSTCYGIVKQTGGFIFVESVANQGSTFSVYLPRHIPVEVEETDEVKAAPKPARDLTGVGRVLLVEDEDAVRLFSTRALRNKGYEVLAANGGEQALELLDEAENRIDLLITDVMMPEMDGPTLIKHVRARIPDIKAICISGYAEDTIRDRLADDTEIHFLGKPFNLEDLASMVKEVISS